MKGGRTQLPVVHLRSLCRSEAAVPLESALLRKIATTAESQQRAAKSDARDRKVDDQAGDIYQRGDQGRRGTRGI
jgi:hypothetical protein